MVLGGTEGGRKKQQLGQGMSEEGRWLCLSLPPEMPFHVLSPSVFLLRAHMSATRTATPIHLLGTWSPIPLQSPHQIFASLFPWLSASLWKLHGALDSGSSFLVLNVPDPVAGLPKATNM